MGNFSIKEKYFKFIIYFIIILLINIVGITLFFRVDLTGDKIYSLSDASKDVVATLSEPLTIKVFFSKNLPAPHNNTERYLRDLLEEYAAKGGKYFNYSFYDVTLDEGSLTKKTDENRNMAKDYRINPVQIQIMENDEVKFKNAYMGLVIIHGDLVERFGAITSTNGLEYQLTTAIQKMNNKVSALQNLDGKVHINMYLSSSLNEIAPLIRLDQLPMLGKKIEQTIAELNNKSLGILEFKHIDVSDKLKLKELENKYNIEPLAWGANPERQILAGQGAAEIVIDFKGQTTNIPLISSLELPGFGTTVYQMAEPDILEEQINSIVEKLIGINMDMGFLAGFGTHSLLPDQMAMMQGKPGGGMQALNALVSKRYTIKSVDLKDYLIPDGMSCLVITRPTQKFSDYELFQIDQALMKGTNIAFISDAFAEVNSQGGMGGPPQFQPIDTGLENMLIHYGVKIKKAYVLDKQAYIHRDPRNRGPKEQILYFAPHIKENAINNTPIFMDNIKEMYAMRIAPLELVPENIDTDKVVATRLLASSEESWLMEGMINLSPQYITPPADAEEMQSYDLAYLLSGEFTSFFKGKTIPQKEMSQEELEEEELGKKEAISENISLQNPFIETSKPAKIFILPSSQMIQDNMLDPQGQTTNTTFLLNIIDHLNGKDSIAQLRSKQQQYNPIEKTTPFLRNIIKAFNIVALPILVILFGIGVLAKRTSRKKKITHRFNV